MNSFAQMTQDWSAFFSALAQVSGGLVGLVFVALTFNTRALGAGGDPMLKALAQQTFGDFVMLLLISLVMLTPHTGEQNVGLSILVFCAVDMLRILRNLLRLRRHLRGGSNWRLTQRFVISAAARVVLGWMGVLMMQAPGVRIDVIGSMLWVGVILLLLSGCRSAWLLVAPLE